MLHYFFKEIIFHKYTVKFDFFSNTGNYFWKMGAGWKTNAMILHNFMNEN